MRVFKLPMNPPINNGVFKLFLAGSIDMGSAIDWQGIIQHRLSGFEIDIFNPRRDAWDASWEQDISNPLFVEQVEWELDQLDAADLIIIYYDPNGKAPISLMEHGLHAKSGKCIVCCPPGYWRRGNVQIVCRRYNIPLYDALD